MCYEFSHWFTKARAAEAAQQPARQTERSSQPPAPAQQPAPVAAATPLKEREAAPA
jgi:hypothetical protein